MRFLIQIFLSLLICAVGYAHGDLHERIVQLSKQIKQKPNLDSLYVMRGQLYYFHTDYANAEKDFFTAVKLGYTGEDINYWQARLCLDMEKYNRGITHISTYLSCYHNDVSAIRIYAQLLSANCDFNQAADYYQKVIALTSGVLPKNYLELVAALQQANRFDEAAEWLKNGIDRLGSLPAFQTALIALYRQQNNVDGILTIYRQQVKQANRKETYYYKLAELYDELGKADSAYLYLNQATMAVNQLPLHIKQTLAMQQLMTNIKKKRGAI